MSILNTIASWFDKGEPTQTHIMPMQDMDKVLVVEDPLDYTPHAAQHDVPKPAPKISEAERDRVLLAKQRK